MLLALHGSAVHKCQALPELQRGGTHRKYTWVLRPRVTSGCSCATKASLSRLSLMWPCTWHALRSAMRPKPRSSAGVQDGTKRGVTTGCTSAVLRPLHQAMPSSHRSRHCVDTAECGAQGFSAPHTPSRLSRPSALDARSRQTDHCTAWSRSSQAMRPHASPPPMHS